MVNNVSRIFFLLTPTLSEFEILNDRIIHNLLVFRFFANILHHLNLAEKILAKIRNYDFRRNHFLIIASC